MAVEDKERKFREKSDIPDSRGKLILSAIISEHLNTGEPVGSKVLSERFANTTKWSSATIRNIMGELEEAGFVEQPHTSAGRVPTDKGYRYYVDNLLGILSLSTEDLRFINKQLGLNDLEAKDKPERLMERTSQILSALSQNVGIVVSPSISHDRLQHIEFVNLSDKRILVVLVSAPDIVHNRIIRLDEALSQDELDRTSRYLNTEFLGKSLSVIRAELLTRMHEEKALFDRMLQTAIILCSQSIEGDKEVGEIYIDGASNILSKPDFSSVARLRELLQTIEERSRLVRILGECIDRESGSKSNVQIVIGSENSSSSLQDCTLITAPYSFGPGAPLGSLSVLGPTRLEYARTIAIVSYVASLIEKIMLDENTKL